MKLPLLVAKCSAARKSRGTWRGSRGPGVKTELYWDNGKENGNYYIIGYMLGLYWDNGKENYCLGFKVEGLGYARA